jgi:hypothetical protein
VAVFFADPAVNIAYRLFAERHRPALTLPPRPPPHDQAEAVRQDLADLALLTDFDRSFSSENRAELQKQVAALAARAGDLGPAAFWLAVSRLVALPGNGHTTVDLAQRAARFNRAPVRFAWFADGLYIVRARPDWAELLGARVAAIDGRPAVAAFDQIRPCLSGTEERARASAPPLLESPELLRAIWPETDGIALDLRLVTRDHATVERRIPALPPGDGSLAAQPIRAMTPQQDQGWRTILQSAPQIPLSLRSPERVAFSAPLDGGRLYVRVNANGNDANGQLTDQLAAIAATRPPAGWNRIVLDLRFNDGGDVRKTAAFARTLPGLLSPKGDVWILTGNATFSAAIITAARARHFLGPRAHIAGETAGDHSRFWSDGGAPLVLRNSGIAIHHAWFLQDWEQGCHSLQECMPYQYIYGVAAGSLAPELKVGWRFGDYAAGRDTLLEQVLAEP